MKAWMLALIGASSRRLVTPPPFTANATWTAPFTTSRLESASGNGAAGAPGTAGTPSRTGWYTITNTTYHRRDGGTEQTATQGPNVFDGSSKPSDYCDPTVFYYNSAAGEHPDATHQFDSAVYSDTTVCYLHYTVTDPGTPGTPDTTGASTTGFGKTFPGGTGGAASTTTFPNVAITPGASYSIVVPAGGSLTISYYQ